MKLYTTDRIKELDAYTILHEPIASIDLMERASVAFVAAFRDKFSAGRRVVVLAGPGNNGGDALAVARLLSRETYHVEVFLYNPDNQLSADCELNRQRLQGLPSVSFTEDVDFSCFPVLDKHCIVIDGLFGSGLNRPLSGGYANLVRHINVSAATVVSIDMPSGLFGEDNSGNDPGAIIQADLTLTFQFPKLSFLLADNYQYVGAWKVLDIGLHPKVLEKTGTDFYLTEKSDIVPLLKSRNTFDHKGTFGHALLVAGSYGKMGAAVLAAKACLRTGVGLLTVRIPPEGMDIIQTAVPEAMATLRDDFEADVAGVGPGIGTGPEVADRLFSFLHHHSCPMVLDADALNILSKNPEQINQIPPMSVLTPHPKEFDRLAGDSDTAYERLQKAKAFAVRYRLYIVLKGAYTVVCTPEGTCFFNTTGNPGMATAGSGDVLTGILLSLLAQGYVPGEAARIGVFLHGMAGDYLVESGTQSLESLLAHDLIAVIGNCFSLLKL